MNKKDKKPEPGLPAAAGQSGFFLLSASALLLIFFFGWLGRFPFLDYDEATYALVTAETMESGNLLTLSRLGQPWLDKPPLYFWLAMGSAKIFGFNEFALRFPSALLGFIAVILTFFIARKLSGSQTVAVISAAVLALNGAFMFSARQFRLDVPVTTAVLFSLLSFLYGLEKRVWLVGIWVGIGIGFMFKSVIALLALPLILLYALLNKERSWLKSVYFWLGFAAAIFAVVPWSIFQWQAQPSAFSDTYMHLILSRYFQPVGGSANSRFLYYFEWLGKLAEPWFLLFWPAAAWLLFRFGRGLAKEKIFFIFAATLGIFIFFQLSATKYFYYLNPLFPFLAIFLAWAGFLFYQTARNSRTLLKVFLAVILAAGLANVLWQTLEIKGGGTWQYALAKDEKQIGLYLARERGGGKLKVYTSNFYNYETIYYYGREASADLAPLGEIDPGPHFLIVPNDILEVYELEPGLKSRSSTVFKGDKLTLFAVSEEKK